MRKGRRAICPRGAPALSAMVTLFNFNPRTATTPRFTFAGLLRFNYVGIWEASS